MSEISFQLKQTAAWRRRIAEKRPADWRNSAAAELLDRLAEMESSSELEHLYFTTHNELAQDTLAEIASPILREIGFSWNPEHIDDVLRRVTEEAAT